MSFGLRSSDLEVQEVLESKAMEFLALDVQPPSKSILNSFTAVKRHDA